MRTATILLRVKLIISLFFIFLVGSPYALAVSAEEGLINEFTFSLNDLSFSKLEGYDVVRLPECIFTRDIGKPQLPYKVVHIVIEEGKEIANVEVLNDTKEPIPEEAVILPAQKSIRNGQTPIFTPPDPNIYNLPESYPKERFVVESGGALSGVNLAILNLYPLEYIPAQKRLYLHTNITLKINFKSVEAKVMPAPPHAAPPASQAAAISPSLKPGNRSQKAKQDLQQLLQKNVINPADIDKQTSAYTLQIPPPAALNSLDYLIITSEALKAAGVFQPLIDSKIAKGLSVEIDSVEAIAATMPGRDSQEKIRNFIKKKFTENGILWVLLGGDTDIVPVRTAVVEGQADEIPCDMYYSDLDGDWDANGNNIFGEIRDNVDLYPDVFVGRAPAVSEVTARIFVEKALTYEANIQEYSGKALFLGFKDFNDAGGRTNDLIEQEYVPSNFSIITKYYERDYAEYAPLALAAMNQGYHLINHVGHADVDVLRCATPNSEDKITIQDINSLTNAQMPAIIWSGGCWPAAIDYDCIAEHWINNPHGGGVAFIGNSRYGYGPDTDYLDSMFFESLFRKGVTHIGQTLADSKISFIPQAKTGGQQMRYCMLELNLLGDPEMEIRVDAESQLAISSPAQGSYVRGRVNVSGSAYLGNGFKRYELYCAPKDKPEKVTLIYSSALAVQNDTLTRGELWNTAKFPDGEYMLILKIITSDDKIIENRSKINVIIDNYNQRPQFANLRNQGVVINRPFDYKVEATDPDDPETPWGKLQYSAANLPAGAHFDSKSGILSWQPTEADKGIYKVTFTVRDSRYASSRIVTLATVVLDETRLTEKSENYSVLSFDNDKVVWNNNGQIYLCDLSRSGEIRRLTVSNDYHYYADAVIHGDKVIVTEGGFVPYTGEYIAGYYVYLYDLSQPAGTPPVLIFTNSNSSSWFSFNNDKIVWQSGWNYDADIYMYDLTKKQKIPICTALKNQSEPAIYQDKIVWTDRRDMGGIDTFGSTYGAIYMYDLSNSNEIENGTPVNPISNRQGQPRVYNNKVAYRNYAASMNGDIVVYDLIAHKESQIASNLAQQAMPNIYGNKLTWVDYRDNPTKNEIYMYDLSRELETRITRDDFQHGTIRMFKNKICWLDFRNKNNDSAADIYLASLTFVPQISSVYPETIFTGSPVKIKGCDFGETQGSGKVWIDGMAAYIQAWSDSEIICQVPIGASRALVRVETEGGKSNEMRIHGNLCGVVYEQIRDFRGVMRSKPLAGANVRVIGNGVNKQAITLNDGSCKFEDLPAGNYMLIASKSRDIPQARRITITANKTTKFSIFLQRLSFPYHY